MWSILSGIVGVYALMVVALFVFQRSLMYQPGHTLPAPSETQIPAAEAFLAQDPKRVSWFLPAKDNRPVVVYFQGNAGTVADRDYKARRFAEAGIGVWLTGYRGFAGNAGAPSEEGLYADARDALAALRARGVSPSDIVLYGESLGTGVAVQMAHELARTGTPARGLILEAPFTSMGAAAQGHYPYVPAKWLVRDKYDSASKIADVGTPLLILHGDADRVVPEPHGRRLFDLANEPKRGVWVPGGGHSDLYDFGVGENIVDFILALSAPR